MIESMVPILGLSVTQREELGFLIEEDVVETAPEQNFEENLENSQGLGSKFMNFLLKDE